MSNQKNMTCVGGQMKYKVENNNLFSYKLANITPRIDRGPNVNYIYFFVKSTNLNLMAMARSLETNTKY